MTFSGVSTWVVQAIVTCLVYSDLGPGGSRFVARSLGLQPGCRTWLWLAALALACVFTGSRVAANASALHEFANVHETGTEVC
jgi:hypothetical protein